MSLRLSQRRIDVLTQKEVEEFKRLVLEVYRKELTFEEAKDQGSRLIRLFELILKEQREAKRLQI